MKKLFKIEISGSGLDESTEEKKGFLDNKRVHEYEDFDILTQPIEGETVEQYMAKARGYIRWKQMCYNISQGGIYYFGEVKAEGADHITQPSKIEFLVGYEQFDGMLIADELNQGEILEGIDALKRRIALALADTLKINDEYFNNTVMVNNNTLRVTGAAEYTITSASNIEEGDVVKTTPCLGYQNVNMVADAVVAGDDRETKITAAEDLITITEIH